MKTRNNKNELSCPCERPGHRPVTSLDPAEFSAEDFCLQHFDVDAARRDPALKALERFRSLPPGEFPVEMGVALAAPMPFRRPRSAETFRTNAVRLLRYHSGQDIRDISPASIEADFASIREEVAARRGATSTPRDDVGDGAVESYVAVLRRVFRRLEPYGVGNPAAAVDKPIRRRKGEREVYTSKQLRDIWDAMGQGDDPRLYRLIFAVMRLTAARRMSVIRLNLEDIDWATGRTILEGKGGRIYEGLLSHNAKRELLRLHCEPAGINASGVPELMAHLDREDYDPTTGAGGTPALLTRSGRRISNRTFEQMQATVRAHVPPGAFRRPYIAHSVRHTTITEINASFGEAAAAGLAGHRSNQERRSSGDATRDYTIVRDGLKIAMFNARFGPDHVAGPIDPGSASPAADRKAG